MTSRVLGALFVLVLSMAPAATAQAGTPPPKGLLRAKMIYVEPMPGHLDQWIIEDLKAWGKYQIASNEEGVDLVLKARKPEKKVHYSSRNAPPVMRRPHKTPPVLSLTVVNWVTGERLWQADVLNSAPKKNEKQPAGPETSVYAKRMTPDQIAARSVDLLRKYVEGLGPAPASKP